jgi:hypothetical protein
MDARLVNPGVTGPARLNACPLGHAFHTTVLKNRIHPALKRYGTLDSEPTVHQIARSFGKPLSPKPADKVEIEGG